MLSAEQVCISPLNQVQSREETDTQHASGQTVRERRDWRCMHLDQYELQSATSLG